MKKHTKSFRPVKLALKKETLVILTDDQLKGVVGGNKSTVKSQCPTLCFE